jgi:hypothetical protein
MEPSLWTEEDRDMVGGRDSSDRRRSQVTAGFRCSAVDEKGWRDFVMVTWRSWGPWLVPASNRGGGELGNGRRWRKGGGGS